MNLFLNSVNFHRDPLQEQDGVAPQCAVKDIDQLPTDKTDGGRAYIPPSVSTKGFLGSHSIENYGWVITRQPGLSGYVKQR